MPASTNIFDLAAKISVDARDLDKTLNSAQKVVKGLEREFRQLDSTTKATSSTLRKDLGGSLGSLVGGGGLLLSLAAGVGLAASGIATVTKALWSLVTSAAAAAGDLQDLSQKTSMTVETLSGLSIAAKTTGSDIHAISASLIIFQKNMGAAQDATSAQAKVFKQLGVDTRDNEKALRQAFTALAKYGDTQKAVEMSTKLFGRSGAAMLAIVKETNGNLDQAIKKYGELGLIISSSAARASDRFNDLLEETTLQLEAVTRSIGLELLPVATDALQRISASLRANKDEWAAWGTSIANVLRGLGVVVSSELGQMLGKISTFYVKYLNIPGLVVQGLGGLGGSVNRPKDDPYSPGGAMRGGRSTLPGTPEWQAAQRRMIQSLNDSIGGGRGGGGRSARSDAGAELLKQMKRELTDLMPKRVMWEKLMGEEYKKTADSIKKKIYITEIEIEAQKKVNDLTRERYAALVRLRTVLPPGLETSVRDRIATLEGLELITAGRPRIATTEEEMRREQAGSTRPQIATDAEKMIREQYSERMGRIQSLASNLSTTIADSIYEGFRGGIKSGLEAFEQGILQMIMSAGLRVLEQKLTNIFSGILAGSSVFGGSGASSGGASGAIGSIAGVFAGSFASGGTIPMGMWGNVHAGEKVRATPAGAQVIPSSRNSSGGHTFNIVINGGVGPNGLPRESVNQLKRQLRDAMTSSTLMG